MKKILSLLLVALMLVGMMPMMPINASAEEVTATLTFDAEKANRTSFSTTQQIWEQNGITFTNDKASSTTNLADYSAPVRLYAGSTVTISYPGMTKLVITSNGTAKYKTALEDSLTKAEYTYTNSGNDYTIEFAEATNSVSFSCVAQARFASITVTANKADETCAHTNTVTVAATEATCTNIGYTEGVQCSDCGEFINGHEKINALGHNESSVVTAPTCTEQGYTTYTCTVCNNERKADYVDATGHTMADGVCSVCGVKQLNTEKATAIAVGDQVIFVCESASMEMNGFYDTSYAYGTAYTDTPLGVNVWTVVSGAAEGTYAFVMDNAYLSWSSGNSAKTSDSLDNNASWTVTFDESGNAVIVNYAGTLAETPVNRQLQWNANNPRFAAYTSTQTAIQLYKLVESGSEEPACEHTNTTTNTVAATCTAVGSETVVCDDCFTFAVS